MQNKRRYWSGRLNPGAVVFHKGKKCLVASDNLLEEMQIEVPGGHVPIHESAYGRGSIYSVPLDDLFIPQKGYRK